MHLCIDSPSAASCPVPLARSLHCPFGSVARQIHSQVIEAVTEGDECALIQALIQATRVLSPAERPQACFLPCIIGLDERKRAGHALGGAQVILRFVRECARGMLAKFPLEARSVWLVPCEADDATAAHLAALLMAQRGQLARPWLWAFPPNAGEFIIVGTTVVHDRGLHLSERARLTTLVSECRPLPTEAGSTVPPVLAHAG